MRRIYNKNYYVCTYAGHGLKEVVSHTVYISLISNKTRTPHYLSYTCNQRTLRHLSHKTDTGNPTYNERSAFKPQDQ